MTFLTQFILSTIYYVIIMALIIFDVVPFYIGIILALIPLVLQYLLLGNFFQKLAI